MAKATDSNAPLLQLPAALQETAQRQWQRLQDACAQADIDVAGFTLGADQHRFHQLLLLLASSEFFADLVCTDPAWLQAQFHADSFASPLTETELRASLRTQLMTCTQMAPLRTVLRRWRNRMQARIIWRDCSGLADMTQTTDSVSLMADVALQETLHLLHGWQVAADGEPLGADSGQPQQLVVIALGKLGARELNLSSDIDLVFAFPEDGTTAHGRRTNQQFFTTLAQQLIQALDGITVDGFVFRVDMRLRPFGDSGPLVCSFAAMERYFEEQGRDWERYAWIRARISAGDLQAGEQLLRTLRPFVFRRYLDFGAIDALRDLKARISAERNARAIADDIKLGPGGIRDVEFIAQMLQLIWAGRHGALRQRRVRATYQALAELNLIQAETAQQLFAGYEFLRNLEHKLQAIRDRQTQKLPQDALDQARVAAMMAFPDFPTLLQTLHQHRRLIAQEFDGLIKPEAGQVAEDRWHLLWQQPDAEQTQAALQALSFPEPETVTALLLRLRAARDRSFVAKEGRTRLDQLMPLFLAAARDSGQPALAVTRVVPLFEAIMRRSAYFVLLLENPQALTELVNICASSRWLSEELARHPALLDELLDPSLLYTVADKETLAAQLAERLRWVTADDFEAQLEVLRRFKESHAFRVAACELKGILPLMHVSDYHSFLAEVILAQALRIAWCSTGDAPTPEPAAFIILGYGKLGGIELGPNSDLDLVFVHQLQEEQVKFLHRMVRRLMQVLTTRMHAGALYEVDMRLRPSGHAGTLVSSLQAFAQYQTQEAWTWEHQALVRARVVAGDPALAAAFAQVRQQILCRPRQQAQLRQEVVAMRQRIADTASGEGDLKRFAGGIVDIEFMVQYLVLAHAQQYPALCTYTDNIRILETAAGLELLSPAQADMLKTAYLGLRAESHRSALDIPDDARAREVLARYQADVRACWDLLLGA